MKKKVLGRYFGIFLTMLGLIVGSITVANPAYASQALCGNYGDAPSFGCVSYSGFSGQRPWGYPVDSNGHNCTNYVTYRLSQNGASNPGNLGNAHEWDNKASSYGFPVNNTPTVGSVAVWEIDSWPAQGSGHVAYVEVVTSTYIDISEDNYGGTTMRRRYFVGQSDWPDHFVHIKDVTTIPSPVVTLTNKFYLNNNFDATHDILTTYGSTNDQALYGDWNGNGVTTLGVRIANTYYLNNTFDGSHDFTVSYGDPNILVVSGDWDGNGTETLAVRYGNTFYLDNGFDGVADITTSYGSSTDSVIAGDWDGDGDDTLGVGVGNTYYLNNNFDTTHDILTSYGEQNASAFAGDWDGDGDDTLGIRSGNAYYLNNNFDTTHDILMTYGDGNDHTLIGDWDGDGTDTIGIREVNIS